MKWLFWGSASLLIYAYFGYPAWLWVRKRIRPRAVKSQPYTPFASIVMVVRNEAPILRRKLENLLALDYPRDQFEVIAVSDGSEDGTQEILASYARDSRVRAIINKVARGKAAGLNEAVAIAKGELVVFTDARQYIEPRAVRLLAENFADPGVGCVSGELMLGDPQSGESVSGVGLYWRMEKYIREMEAASASVVGATGAIYAVKRRFLVPLPAEIILDDVFIPMNVVRQGARVAFEPRARAWDAADLGRDREFARKVRTLNGNYQLLQIAPWLLSSANPIRFEFVSHKLLRLIAPFALAITMVVSFLLPQPIYKFAFWSQLGFYGLSVLAMVHLTRGPVTHLANAALTFVTLNTAAVVAFVNFVTGRKTVWIR
jgi:cellulose synthase/poly-beta-1,6-N-acetylglucosamine synthase-like glycosyltransferase